MESPTLQRVDEDDVALDMDGWDLYGNSDEPSDEEGESDVDDSEGFDFSWERVLGGLNADFDREALAHGPINNDEVKFYKKTRIPHFT